MDKETAIDAYDETEFYHEQVLPLLAEAVKKMEERNITHTITCVYAVSEQGYAIHSQSHVMRDDVPNCIPVSYVAVGDSAFADQAFQLSVMSGAHDRVHDRGDNEVKQ